MPSEILRAALAIFACLTIAQFGYGGLAPGGLMIGGLMDPSHGSGLSRAAVVFIASGALLAAALWVALWLGVIET